MNDTILAAENLRPVCMTFEGLRAVLWPFVAGYRWGEETIYDLWKLGAPMPPMPGRAVAGDVRLIVPSQLMVWLEDVLKRQGRPLSESAALYARMIKESD
jgi:hypothetical protein